MKCKYSTLLFDLDGTLSKSGDGVKDGIIFTLNKMNKPVPDLSDYSLYVGPPLIDTFEKVAHLNKEDCLEAIAIYGDYYNNHAKFKNSLYDGLLQLLKNLKKADVRLAVTTTKNEDFAKWVLEYLGVIDFFDVVSGVTADYRIRTKLQVIQNALEIMKITDTKGIALIGDTVFDAIGAKEAGTYFIGVSYGYGKKDEMIKNGALFIAETPDELSRYLFS